MLNLFKRFLIWTYYYIVTYRIRRRFKQAGKDIFISSGIKFQAPSMIEIGSNVRFLGSSKIRGDGGIKIGSNVSIGGGCTILSSSHRFRGADALPYDYHKIRRAVIIEDNVWIGENVSINPGVHIQEGAIISLGSVVVKDVEPLSIIGGNPGVVIGSRDKEEYLQLKNDKFARYKLFYKMKIIYK
jgi:maltose O-acetyltransferase